MDINVYAIVTPFVLLLILAEIAWCVWKRNGYYEFQDSIASLGTAVINQCVNVVVSAAWLPVLYFLYELAPLKLENTPLNAVLLFLGVDFLFYWFHRFGHRTNIGWAAHMPHHSTEELNYAVALRASVTQRFFSFFFYWPLALVGFSPAVIVAMVAFHLVLQLIPHTRVVPKLPRFIESWMNTPSHHRVHHARNDEYLDRNYGGFLIIWDKFFGTFQAEEAPCSYGVTVPPNTWDPTFINVQVWKEVVADAWHAPKWFDKLRVWFMPTGWRPEGLAPRAKKGWKHDGREVKFQSTPINGSKAYLVAHVALTFPVMLLVTRPDSPLTTWDKVLLSLVLWLAATSWSAILESRRFALPLEAGRLVLQAALLGSFTLRGMLPTTAGALTLSIAAASLLWVATRTRPTALLPVAAERPGS